MTGIKKFSFVYFGGFIAFLLLNQIANPWHDLIAFRVAMKFIGYFGITFVALAIALLIAKIPEQNRQKPITRFLIPAVIVTWPIYAIDIVSDIGETRKLTKYLKSSSQDETVATNSVSLNDINNWMMQSARNGDAEAVQLLIADGADVNARGEEGYSALSGAAGNGHTEIVGLLLEAGADPNARLTNGTNAVDEAAWKGQSEVVKLLISAGADPDQSKDNGYTAIISAASRGHIDTVRYLISVGADVNAETRNGMSAAEGAATFGHDEIVRLLVINGADLHR